MTRNQRKILAMLRKDMEAMDLWPREHVKIVLDDSLLANNWKGYCDSSEYCHYIVLRESLNYGLLYSTAAHEIGHALGLNHTNHGIMAANEKNKIRALNLRTRRRWLGQIARAVVAKKLQNLR